MKKAKKVGIIIAVIFGLFCVSIPIIAGGYIFMNRQEENKESPKKKVTEEEKKLMEEQKADIELSLKYNYNGIKKVTLVGLEKTPLGYFINGYVNDNRKLNFSAGISDGKFDDTMSMSAELEDLAKFDTNKSLSEIKKEQKYLNSQKSNIELFLKYNYKDITSVTLTSVKNTPLGPTIQGYVNNNKNITFTALSSNNGFDSGLEVSDELLKLSKFDKDKSVSEIKKEQQETSMNTSENPKRSLEDIMAELREQEAYLFKRNHI